VIRPRRLVLLGHPVSHSLSPQIQNAALRAAGLDVRYEAVDVEAAELRGRLSLLASDGTAGNITVPHKTRAMDCMGSLTSRAREVGAVNTFALDGRGGLVGHNTDVEGFDAFARSVGAIRDGLRIAVIGAGGAAAAVLAAIREWPNARARIIARNPQNAAALASRFSDVASVGHDSLHDRIAADLVVNATPVGLTDDSFPLELEKLEAHTVVLDLAYRPDTTAWVRAARERGHVAADGITMLVEQAAAAFTWWFDTEPDRDAMWRAVAESSPT
jgi:shikimate dehydrogenase